MEKIQAVVDAIRACEGVMIPYPLARKMFEVCEELEGFLRGETPDDPEFKKAITT